MIDIASEQLLPLTKVPGYLERRGLGRRVHIASVHRWARYGAGGVVLESIRIGGIAVTSVEALQRWVVARAEASASQPQPGGPTSAPAPSAGAVPGKLIPRDAETSRILMKYRMIPTPLEGTLAKLGMSGNVGYVSDVLHRAGFLTDADVVRASKEQLLAIPRLGPFGRQLVTVLKDRVDGAEAPAAE